MGEQASSPSSGRRSVICPVHHIPYDPGAHAGCGLCRRDAAAPGSRAGALLRGLLLAGALCAVGVGVFWRTDSGRTGETVPDWAAAPAAPEAGLDEPRRRLGMDPEPFRAQIEALERVLYKSAPADFQDAGRIEVAAGELAGKMLETRRSLLARDAALRIGEFASSIGVTEEVGYAVVSLAAARAQWEALRAEIFAPAPWFATAAPELAAAQAPPTPVLDPRTLEELERAADSIARLVEVGASEVEGFGEVAVDVAEESAEARRLVARWNAWSREWDERVRLVASNLPAAPGPRAALDVQMAYQSLGSALHELQLLPVAANDYGVPFRSEREYRLRNARAALDEARRSLTQVRQSAP